MNQQIQNFVFCLCHNTATVCTIKTQYAHWHYKYVERYYNLLRQLFIFPQVRLHRLLGNTYWIIIIFFFCMVIIIISIYLWKFPFRCSLIFYFFKIFSYLFLNSFLVYPHSTPPAPPLQPYYNHTFYYLNDFCFTKLSLYSSM